MNDNQTNKNEENGLKLDFQDTQIWGHIHRMYLLGDGSITHPWIIPKDFPVHAL